VEIIDGQLHEPGLQRFWDDTDRVVQHAAMREATDTLLAAVGVDGALLHPIEDMSWAYGMAEREPHRFAVVPMVARRIHGVARGDWIDVDAPDLDDQLQQAADRPGCVAFRFGMLGEQDTPIAPGSGYDTTLRFCAQRGVALCSPFARYTNVVVEVARAHPDVTLVVDQLALPIAPADDGDPWATLPDVLELAEHPNVHLKVTGVPSLSRAAYPYLDVREPVRRVLDAFGAARCLWASDISFYRGQVGWANRFPALVGDYPGKHTYAQAVGFWRDGEWLTHDEQIDILGRTARRVFSWPS